MLSSAVITALGAAAAAFITGDYYYDHYSGEIQDILNQLDGMEDDDEIYIEQKWRYHGGHKSWYPLNEFRLSE